MLFVPMVAETAGGWDSAALETWKLFARAESARTGQRAAAVLERHLQSLSIAIRRSAAIAILRRDRAPDGIPAPTATWEWEEDTDRPS